MLGIRSEFFELHYFMISDLVQGCCSTHHHPRSELQNVNFLYRSFLVHPLLKTTLTGLRRTYLRFLVFRPKLTKTKRFPPFLDHMNGKLFLGGSRFWSGKIGPKLALGGHRSQCPAELSFFFNRCPAGNPLFLTDKIYF